MKLEKAKNSKPRVWIKKKWQETTRFILIPYQLSVAVFKQSKHHLHFPHKCSIHCTRIVCCIFFSYQNGLFPHGGLCCRPPCRCCCCCCTPPPPFCRCDNTLNLCSFMLANSESRVCGLCLGVAFVCGWAGADTYRRKVGGGNKRDQTIAIH